MAIDENVKIITLRSAADLSSDQYEFLYVNASGQVAAVTATGHRAIGVLYNDPAAADLEAAVAIGGKVKVKAGAALTAGSHVMTDTSARAITATATNNIVGVALTSATAAGDIITILWQPHGVL